MKSRRPGRKRNVLFDSILLLILCSESVLAGSSIFRLSQDPGGALISNGKRRVVETTRGKKDRSGSDGKAKKKKLDFEIDGTVELENAQSESAISPWARTLSSGTLSSIFHDDSSIRKIYIYTRKTGDLTTFKFSEKGAIPYGFDRNSGAGSFQQMILNAKNNDENSLSVLRVCTHKQMKTQLLVIDDECGKRWEASDSFFVNTIPQPGMSEIWTGRRSARPFDSAVSLLPLDETPFQTSQQAFYAPVVDKIENSENEQDEYATLFHFQGWTSRYSRLNITHNLFSLTDSPPSGYSKVESSARSIAGFSFPAKANPSTKTLSLCQAYESRAPPEWSRKGEGIVIKSQTIISDKSCEELKRDAKEIAILNVWEDQNTAPKGASQMYITQRTAWPHDQLLSFSAVTRDLGGFKPVAKFWAIPLEANQNGKNELLVSGIRSNRMNVEWRKDPLIRSYKIDVQPPPKIIQKEETKSNVLLLKSLSPDTEYEITVTPVSSSGEELSPMTAVRRTAPGAPEIRFPYIRSTSIEVEIGGVQDGEIRLKVTPEVEITSSDSNHLTLITEPDTEYTVTVFVVVDQDEDLQTSEMTRIVRSSPSPEELDVKVSMVDGKFDVNVNGMGAHSFNIEVISESDQEAASSRSFSVAQNHATLEDMEFSRKKSLTFFVAAKMGRSANGEVRESDAIAIETPFRLCNWVEEESRLSCTGKEGLRSQILAWSVIGDRVQVNVQDVGQTDIPCEVVRVLNVDGNLLNGAELKSFVSKFKNLERLNASKNRISSLPFDIFMNTPKLWKINLSENFIEAFHKDTFIFTQALQVLDVSNNPLAYCGLGIGHLRTLESKLRILDLRATNFPTKLEGHWNALMLYYDVGEAPRIIHQAVFPRLCPVHKTRS